MQSTSTFLIAVIFSCNDYFFCIYDSILSISSISSSNSRSRLSSNSSRSPSSNSSRINNNHHEDNKDKNNDNNNYREYNDLNIHNIDDIDLCINNTKYIIIHLDIIDYINIYINIPKHDYNNYINNRECFNIHFNIDKYTDNNFYKYINHNFDIIISIFLYLVINNEITNHININIDVDNDNNNDNDKIHNNHYIDNIVYKHNVQYIVIVIVILNNVIIVNNIFYNLIIIENIDNNNNNAIVNENNLDNNYLTSSSSSQSTLIINIVTTIVITQVNNFCNICNKIGATNSTGYHNLIERCDNKVDSSIGNIIKRERFSTIRATVNNDYLNIILFERFDTNVATGNVSYLSLIDKELFDTFGETTKASRNDVIRRESYNTNEETANNSGDFFDDFLNVRWCDGQRTITPRGGVNKQRPLLPWLKLHEEDDYPTTSESTHPEHPSEHPEFDIFSTLN